MEDPSSSNIQSNIDISVGKNPKSASVKDTRKSYGRVVMKLQYPDRSNPSNKAQDKFGFIKEAFKALSIKKKEDHEANTCNNGDQPKTPKKKKSFKKKKSINNIDDVDDKELHISSPRLLSRTTSYISSSTSPLMPTPNLSKSLTQTRISSSMEYHNNNFHASSSSSLSSWASTPSTGPNIKPKDLTFLSKAASLKSTTPIFFSQSVVRKKPQPIEKKLECSLEELCHGCVKKISITRDAISSSGLIVQEEETLLIKVKPGWKKGTKIIFEGKGDERPGTLPADIIFAIDEKMHPIFERSEGDDLEMGVEIPLVQALTGCTISVPLLGGGEISLSIDDIIYPGYEKIISGQGMPKSNEEGKRGDLKIKFLVEFPDELGDDQRSEVVRILEECS